MTPLIPALAGALLAEHLQERVEGSNNTTTPELPESIQQRLERTYHPNIRAIRGLEKPVVCAVNGIAVDASGQLPDGAKFNGPAELNKLLRANSDQFLTTAIEKLLTYALGRGLEASEDR